MAVLSLVMVLGTLDMPNSVILLIRHLYLSGMWLGMDLRLEMEAICFFKRLDCVLNI
jgi:hypothetical protein